MATNSNKKSGGSKKYGRNERKYAYRKSEALKVHALGRDSGKTYVRTDAAGQEWNWEDNCPAELGNRMVKASREHRNRGPHDVKTTMAKGGRVSSLYVRNITDEEMAQSRVRAQMASRIHVSFATPKAARLAGSLIDLYEVQVEKIPQSQVAADD